MLHPSDKPSHGYPPWFSVTCWGDQKTERSTEMYLSPFRSFMISLPSLSHDSHEEIGTRRPEMPGLERGAEQFAK
jgi:hypothetical protein